MRPTNVPANTRRALAAMNRHGFDGVTIIHLFGCSFTPLGGKFGWSSKSRCPYAAEVSLSATVIKNRASTKPAFALPHGNLGAPCATVSKIRPSSAAHLDGDLDRVRFRCIMYNDTET